MSTLPQVRTGSHLIKIRVNCLLKLTPRDNPKEEVVIDLGIVKLQEAAREMLDFHQFFQRLMKVGCGSRKQKVTAIGYLPLHHKVLLKECPGNREALDCLPVTQGDRDLLSM